MEFFFTKVLNETIIRDLHKQHSEKKNHLFQEIKKYLPFDY